MVDDEKSGIDHSQQHLANERTFLAWVRTCIAVIGLGFIVAKFSCFMVEFRLLIQQEYSSGPNRQSLNHAQSQIDQVSYLIGTGMVILAIMLILFAMKNYLGTNKSIKTQLYSPNHGIIYTASAAIVILSLIVFMYLLYVPIVNL
ncbi:MAG TPA: DUF202 domain-containing protein [Phototrophicaceae bacterium]|nr:DUF202 domain-containing protein [Phototrophicaceae bacterium]